MKLENMTWLEVETYIASRHGVILPTGSIEQHGPNGLIGTDASVTRDGMDAPSVGRENDRLISLDALRSLPGQNSCCAAFAGSAFCLKPFAGAETTWVPLKISATSPFYCHLCRLVDEQTVAIKSVGGYP